jgi:hypothetical protein
MKGKTEPIRLNNSFSNVRIQAEAIWRGPKNLVIRDPASEPFYGWPHLCLEAKMSGTDRVEARSIYANLFDVSQPFAILRAVYWDGVSTRTAFRKSIKSFTLKLPARFVKIPIRKLKIWLSEFDGVNVALSGIDESNDDVEIIRRLRIEYDYMSCVFEKVWQIQDKNHSILNQKWQKLWTQTTKALVIEPLVTNFDEDFWFVLPKVKYDYKTYKPEQ